MRLLLFPPSPRHPLPPCHMLWSLPILLPSVTGVVLVASFFLRCGRLQRHHLDPSPGSWVTISILTSLLPGPCHQPAQCL